MALYANVDMLVMLKNGEIWIVYRNGPKGEPCIVPDSIEWYIKQLFLLII